MIPERFVSPLKYVNRKITSSCIDYALVGSANLALQGMDLTPRDIDIVARVEDLEEIRRLFVRYSPTGIEEMVPSSADLAWTKKLENHPAWGFYFNKSGIPVHVLGEDNDGDYVGNLVANKVVYIPLDGISIPCFTFDAEIDSYERTFRPDKARNVRKFLANKN